MKTNCKEVSTDSETTWSVLEVINFETARQYVEQGNKNVVGSYGDSGVSVSVKDMEDLFDMDNDGLEFGIVRYFEYK